jgi:uncharacterized membrane protein YoaK (UPF0700 family)/anti-anti-sigma regulatory factor
MFASQAHSFTQQARLAITLAWVAGYTNILTVLSCGMVTSHMTGTASNLGRDVAERAWHSAAFMFFLLAMFVLGALISGVVTEFGRRRGWESIYVLPIAIQAALLSLFALGLELHDATWRASGPILWQLTGLAAAAMGLQNATITRISSGVIRTTHLTGVLTDLGSETAQFLFWLRDRKSDSPPLSPPALVRSARAHPTARRLALLASITASFALGAGLGTLAHDHAARWSMVPPVLFLMWIIVADIRKPICEIETSGVFGAGQGFPEGLAVYHLRRDKGRRGRVHRLPDLTRWCERLPDVSRVVILDLDEVTVLDENAALELRALARQLTAAGRRLLIAGISGEQYRALREAGAADVIDPSSVCPDLELAVARGLMLLDGPRAAR